MCLTAQSSIMYVDVILFLFHSKYIAQQQKKNSTNLFLLFSIEIKANDLFFHLFLILLDLTDGNINLSGNYSFFFFY